MIETNGNDPPVKLNPRPDVALIARVYCAAGRVSEAEAPAFNAPNLFHVPMLHAVTPVSGFAVGPRYSITDWLRERPASA